jgi:hypothetical protein
MQAQDCLQMKPKIPFSDLWPKRRANAPKMSERERQYRLRVRMNKARIARSRPVDA